MQPLKIVPAACLAEHPAEHSAFIGVVVLSMQRDGDLDEDFIVLLNPAERTAVELAAIHQAEVQLCYFFALQFAEFFI